MALRRIVDAATEPVTVAEVEEHCRIGAGIDTSLIERLITAARMTAENELCRSLITQTWEKTLDAWPFASDVAYTNEAAIRLDYPPIVSVESVKYLEATAGALTTLSPTSYIVDITSEPGWVLPAYSYDWPNLYPEINAVRVRYQAGYGDAADVPPAIKQWILLTVGHYYENRESSFPAQSIGPLPFISGLLDPFRIVLF